MVKDFSEYSHTKYRCQFASIVYPCCVSRVCPAALLPRIQVVGWQRFSTNFRRLEFKKKITNTDTTACIMNMFMIVIQYGVWTVDTCRSEYFRVIVKNDIQQ